MSTSTQKAELKMVFLGSISCGKTCTLLQFTKDTFKESAPTIGASYMSKTMNVRNVKVKFQLWDTAGQEKFHSITGMYFRKADAVILMYDITSNKSFSDIKSWKMDIEKHAPEDAIIALVGNKIDLEKNRVITYRQGSQAAKQMGMSFFEISAKERLGITELFTKLAEDILSKRKDIVLGDPQDVEGFVVVNSSTSPLEDPDSVSNYNKSRTSRFLKFCGYG